MRHLQQGGSFVGQLERLLLRHICGLPIRNIHPVCAESREVSDLCVWEVFRDDYLDYAENGPSGDMFYACIGIHIRPRSMQECLNGRMLHLSCIYWIIATVI